MFIHLITIKSFFLLIMSFYTDNGSMDYAVKNINSELLKESKAVYRQHHVQFEIKSEKSCVLIVKKAITILDKTGEQFAVETVNYDKFIKVKSFDATLFDASGKKIKKSKKSDVFDRSNVSNFSIYEDNRIKILDARHVSYPYTVEFNYEVEFNSLFQIPAFYAVEGFNVSVENASYTMTYSSEILKPRNLVYNTAQSASIISEEGKTSENWQFENIKSFVKEPYGPSLSRLSPVILYSPSKFYYDGTSGDMSNWKDIGKWINQLNEGRGAISAETTADIQQMIGKYDDKRALVQAIYEYMQNRTRYVSIQLGIGGFQPFEAMTVDNLGYGDCKALSNYTKSLLDVAGIKSNYTLISAGSSYRAINNDFPSLSFNHAVLAVPMEKDTIWLECTSQTNPFNYSGNFTGNRKALMIKDNGAVIVNTNKYLKEDNKQIRKVKLDIKDNGDALAEISTQYGGLQFENDDLYHKLDKGSKDQRDWILSNFPIPSFNLIDFAVSLESVEPICGSVEINVELKNICTITGKRLFLTPNLLNKRSYAPNSNKERINDIFVNIAYVDIDSVEVNIPQSYYLETTPVNISHKTKYGDYTLDWLIDAGKVTMIRTLEINKGTYESTEYKDFANFFETVKKHDNTKLVFLNKS